MKRIGIVLIAVAVQFSLSASAAEFPFSHVTSPCQPSDQIIFDHSVSKAWQPKLSTSPDNERDAIRLFAMSYALRVTSTNMEAQIIGQYGMGRALYQMKLIHLAHEIFSDALAFPSKPDLDGIKRAATVCINQIQTRYPTLSMSDAGAKHLGDVSLTQAEPEERAALSAVSARYLARKFADVQDISATDENVVRLIQNDGPYLNYVLALRSAKQQKDIETIQYAEKFLSFTALPKGLEDKRDMMHTLAGESYYQQKNYKLAMDHFRAVQPTSNYLAQSLSGLGWSYLLQKRYDDSLGASRSFIMGGLSRTYAPEAPLIAAITFVESCDYPQALKSVELFRHNYTGIYRWMYNWYKGLPATGNLYQKVAAYLGKREQIPDRIATEWIRSPIFIADQEELNLLYDEKQTLKTFIPKFNVYAKKNPGMKKYISPLQAMVDRSTRTMEDREKGIVAHTNADLIARTKGMLKLVADQWENGQLVEAEVYNVIGDKILADNVPPEYRRLAEKMKNPPKNDGASWDWGRVPSSDNSVEGEVWEDELGYLKSDLKNHCNPTANK